MQAVIDVVLPVFGLIFTGLLAGRHGLLGQDSTEALNKFVYWFALPALFFVGMSRVPVRDVFNLAYIATFLGGVAISALVVVAVARIAFPARPEETAVAAFLGAFSNSGYMGIPFFLTAFGAAGQLPVIIASVLNGAVVVSAAAIAVELTLHRDRGLARALTEVARAIVTNPLMVAMAAGIAWSATGIGLAKPFQVFLDLLGACAGPCALFAVGLFLAGQDSAALFDRRRSVEVGWISFVKLVVQPAATWVVGAWLGLPDFWLACAVISAAFPAGATAFVIAQRYKVYIERTSATIMLSTILSLLTLSALMVILDPRP
jgi:malonate transporter